MVASSTADAAGPRERREGRAGAGGGRAHVLLRTVQVLHLLRIWPRPERGTGRIGRRGGRRVGGVGERRAGASSVGCRRCRVDAEVGGSAGGRTDSCGLP